MTQDLPFPMTRVNWDGRSFSAIELLFSGSSADGRGVSSFKTSLSSPRKEHMDEELEVEREEVVEGVAVVDVRGKDTGPPVEEETERDGPVVVIVVVTEQEGVVLESNVVELSCWLRRGWVEVSPGGLYGGNGVRMIAFSSLRQDRR